MNKEELSEKFILLEQKYNEVVDVFEKNKALVPDYLGYQTLQGRLLEKPLVLIMGFNPGAGYYEECKIAGEFPRPRTFEKTPMDTLDWFKDGSLRYGKWNGNGKTKNHNKFIANGIRVLEYLDDEGIMGNEKKKQGTDEWAEWMNNHIMYTNLYPISTPGISSYKEIIFNIYGVTGKKYYDFVKTNFIDVMSEMVDLIKPQVVVCLGTETYNDYTFNAKTVKKDGDGFYYSIKYPQILGISRERGWNSEQKLRKFAKRIMELLKSNN